LRRQIDVFDAEIIKGLRNLFGLSRSKAQVGQEPIPQPPLSRSAGEGWGVRVARIAASFLDRLRRSLALTPTLSQMEREHCDRL